MAEDNFQSAADEASIEEPISYDGCATLKSCFVSVLKDIFCFVTLTSPTPTVHREREQDSATLSKLGLAAARFIVSYCCYLK